MGELTSVPQLPRQTQPSWRPCINVNIRMFTQDVVSAIRADHRVRIARRFTRLFRNELRATGHRNSPVRNALTKLF